MNAQDIYDRAPFGALIRYSDGAPRPARRSKKKLQVWEYHNAQGFLVLKEPAVMGAGYATPDRFTLRKTAFSDAATPIVAIHCQLFTVRSAFTFEILALPRPDQILIFYPTGDSRELIHIATDEAAARLWLAQHPHPNAILETAGPTGP